jgi:type I restriction enzyme M protein
MKKQKTNFSFKSEEDVKIHFAIPMLEGLGYKKECMTFEETISIQEGTKKKNIFADIVIYTSKKKDTPLIVVDTKAPNEILDRDDREQVISYARLLQKIAPLAVLTNGIGTQIYQTIDKTRIKALPNREDVLTNFVTTVISAGIANSLRAEAKKQLFTIEDVGTFKKLLNNCHNIIRNNEGYDPTQAFDELSKVLFAKMYEEKHNGNQSRFTLTTFRDTKSRLGVNIVQQIFKDIQTVPEFNNLFSEETKIVLQDRSIESIVGTFEKYDLTLTRFDVKGEAFEHFLGDTFTGGLGQYFTPRNVIEFIVDAVQPKIGEKIIDPFCGTGGFLIYAFEAVSEKIKLQDFSESEKTKWRNRLSNESLYGTDWIQRTAQACKMNMIVHGDGNTGVFKHNGFVDIPDIITNGIFDLCLTNPPFGATESDPEILNKFELGQGRKSQERMVLALERCVKLVKAGGTIGMVMMDGVLNNDSYHYVRTFLNQEVELLAVIGLNEETFQGYSAQAKTSILIMRRREKSEFEERDVFMAVCENSGYAPNGLPIAGNQLTDILFDYKKYITSCDTDFIHRNTRIIRIKDASKRIDAEFYVPVGESLASEPPIDIANNLFEKIEMMQTTMVSIKEAISLQTKFMKYEWIPVSKILQPIAKYIDIVPTTKYKLLGIHGKGEGVFVKSEKTGSEFKAKSLNQVSENWFVYSRLFAQNGSFAIIDKEFVGGCMSDEFPTFEVIDRRFDVRDILEYLVFYLNSPSVLPMIKSSRTGSTKKSRGRFKEGQFLEKEIPIPLDTTLLSKIVESIRMIHNFQNSIKQLSTHADRLPRSLQLEMPTIPQPKEKTESQESSKYSLPSNLPPSFDEAMKVILQVKPEK